ncbi:S8/S53 family peptidase [Pedococcus sp. KACC 23699]|uniref:S8/S53 family peptidase n=1 Tax=Pedococcus sp. KACC 23699 TaxID=3149228 RepID=A0AAU7JU79_9MICO
MTARHLRRCLGAAAAATTASVVLLVPASAQATPSTASALAVRPVAVAAGVVADDAADLARASWWRDAMGVDEMQRTATGKGITVAVIDGPFNAQVPELKGKLKARSTCPTAPAQTTDAIASHATTMAALIGGTGKGTAGGNGVRGIAPDVRLLGYTIADAGGGIRPGDLKCGSPVNAMSNAIDAAVKDGANILSISIGAADTTSNQALGRAQRAGVIVVAATDDHDKTVGYPGLANGVLAVNAVDQKVQLATFSAPWKYRDDIATVAPGIEVNSIYRTENGWTSAGRAGGSSHAAAIVSGGLALVWSHFPKATANQIIQLMVNTPGIKVAQGKDGKKGFFTSFRRSGAGLPHGDTKTGYGYGVFDPADMLKGDPSTYPDVNPFLDPADGFKPSYQEVTGKAPPASGTTTPSSGTSPTSGAMPRSGTTATSKPDGGATKADSVSTQDGGTPGWIWVALVLVVLVLAGVGFGVMRGRGTTTNSGEGN